MTSFGQSGQRFTLRSKSLIFTCLRLQLPARCCGLAFDGEIRCQSLHSPRHAVQHSRSPHTRRRSETHFVCFDVCKSQKTCWKRIFCKAVLKLSTVSKFYRTKDLRSGGTAQLSVAPRAPSDFLLWGKLAIHKHFCSVVHARRRLSDSGRRAIQTGRWPRQKSHHFLPTDSNTRMPVSLKTHWFPNLCHSGNNHSRNHRRGKTRT